MHECVTLNNLTVQTRKIIFSPSLQNVFLVIRLSPLYNTSKFLDECDLHQTQHTGIETGVYKYIGRSTVTTFRWLRYGFLDIQCIISHFRIAWTQGHKGPDETKLQAGLSHGPGV